MNTARDRWVLEYIHVSKDFKDAETMHSGQLSHVPSESVVFLRQDERGDLLGSAKSMPPKFRNTSLPRDTFVQVHLYILRHPIQGYPHHGVIQMQRAFPREAVRGSSPMGSLFLTEHNSQSTLRWSVHFGETAMAGEGLSSRLDFAGELTLLSWRLKWKDVGHAGRRFSSPSWRGPKPATKRS